MFQKNCASGYKIAWVFNLFPPPFCLESLCNITFCEALFFFPFQSLSEMNWQEEIYISLHDCRILEFKQ